MNIKRKEEIIKEYTELNFIIKKNLQKSAALSKINPCMSDRFLISAEKNKDIQKEIENILQYCGYRIVVIDKAGNFDIVED